MTGIYDDAIESVIDALNEYGGDAVYRSKNAPVTTIPASPTIFSPNDSTSVVTETSLGSTNSNAPILPSANVPYAMATGLASSGSINLTLNQNFQLFAVVWHDGTLNESNIGSAFNSPLASNVGICLYGYAIAGNVNIFVNFDVNKTDQGQLNSSTNLILSLNNGHLTINGTLANNSDVFMDATAFQHCNIINTATLSGSTANIETITFVNNLLNGNSASKPAWRPVANTFTDYTVKMAFLPRRRQTQETQYIINGSDMPTGMTTVLIAPLPVEPTTKDVIIRNGKELRIESINTINVNGQIVLHKMVVDG